MKKILALLLAGVHDRGSGCLRHPRRIPAETTTLQTTVLLLPVTPWSSVSLNPSPATTALAASRRSWVCSTQTLSLLL